MFRKYKEAVDGSAPPAESLDFEEFISFLDIEHYLGLRGSDTSSSEGNETQVAVKRYIGQVIWEATPRLKNIPPLYLEFARRLKGGDTVITFNYDTLLEESLDAVGQPYRLFRERFTQIGTLSCTTDMSLHEVVLLKPHGSVGSLSFVFHIHQLFMTPAIRLLLHIFWHLPTLRSRIRRRIEGLLVRLGKNRLA